LINKEDAAASEPVDGVVYEHVQREHAVERARVASCCGCVERRVEVRACAGAGACAVVHVRLPGQVHPHRAEWLWQVRSLLSLLNRSCLLHRFVRDEWKSLSSHTIGVEFANNIIKLGTGKRRKRIKLQVSSPPFSLISYGTQQDRNGFVR
jgi:hypothetical protein